MNPGGLAAAIGINALLVAGIITAAPKIVPTEIWDTLPTDHIPLPPDPPPPPPERVIEKASTDTPRPVDSYVPPVEVVLPIPPTNPMGTDVLPPPTPPTLPPGTGTATDIAPIAPPKAAPVLVGAVLRGGDLQPDYPAEMRRAGMEGRVVVRVLVGTDGRVKAVEQVSSPSDSFFAATKRQALSRWRFSPATRDGEPYESWKTVAISFTLTE